MTMQNKTGTVPTPDQEMDVMDNIYLAIAWHGAREHPIPMALTHIYMLVCPRVNDTQYALVPELRIVAFANARQAEIYYQTISAAHAYQKTMRELKTIMEMYQEEIANFNQRVR